MARSNGELYVFALALSGLPATLRLQSRTLHTLRIGPVDAVVERRRERPTPAQDMLQEQHDIVTALLDRTDALLPARFGAWLSETSLRETVASGERAVLDALSLVRGRRQMTVRVFGEAEPAVTVGDVASSGTAYLERRRARAHHVPREVEIIREAMRELVVAERVEAGMRALRVTIFHLVAVADTGEYTRRAEALDVAPHMIRVSGPWPAFAFTPELFRD